MFIRRARPVCEGLRAARADKSLENTLDWALDRMKQKGFLVKSRVSLSVDPKLAIMGYAKKEGSSHRIIISEWALDSDMLGGLILHELSHVYFTESGAPSHDGEILDEVMGRLTEREGLRAKESEFLVDAFNHLQNILVDDLVFAVLEAKELEMTRRFFSEWVSEKPSGDPVLDAALLARNAFAVASLKRRDLSDWNDEMTLRNREFVAALGRQAESDFDWLETFLEKSSPDWGREEFAASVQEYFERILSMMRASGRLDDLR